MPVVPSAVMESSSEDSLEELNHEYHDGEWAVVNLASLQSIPFSDYSHSPYGQESHYLDTHSAISTGGSMKPVTSAGLPASSLGSPSLTTTTARKLAREGSGVVAGASGRRPSTPLARNGVAPSITALASASAPTSPQPPVTLTAAVAPANDTAAAAAAAPMPAPTPRRRSRRVLERLVRRELSKLGPPSVGVEPGRPPLPPLPAHERGTDAGVGPSPAPSVSPPGTVPGPALPPLTAVVGERQGRGRAAPPPQVERPTPLASPCVAQSMRELTNARRVLPLLSAANDGAAVGGSGGGRGLGPRSGEAHTSQRVGPHLSAPAEEARDKDGPALAQGRTAVSEVPAHPAGMRRGSEGRQGPPPPRGASCRETAVPGPRAHSPSSSSGRPSSGSSNDSGRRGGGVGLALFTAIPAEPGDPAPTPTAADPLERRATRGEPTTGPPLAQGQPRGGVYVYSCSSSDEIVPDGAGQAVRRRRLLCAPLPPRPPGESALSTTASGSRVPTASERAATASEERLVAFVREVSDPEVLHVIYDYMKERGEGRPYRQAARVCQELLEQKERLLERMAAGRDRASSRSRRSLGAGRRYSRPMLPDADGDADTVGSASVEGTDTDDDSEPADEFGDLDFHDTPYPDVGGPFQFGEPTVAGAASPVFKEGMLFKVKDVRGDYYFYNDTLNQVMMVRAQCFLRGSERINERAIVSPVEGTGAVEVTIAVLPEETNFFMGNCKRLPRIVAKAVVTPTDFIPPSVTRYMTRMNTEINAVRAALGQWSKATDQRAYIRCCLRHRLPFTDLDFRPSAASLYRPHVDVVKVPPLTWRRPREYLALTEVAESRLFRGEISCHLVGQGELSNHTVVAAMAAIAQYPHHVMWMFRHPSSDVAGKRERAVGCYRVTLLTHGWWTGYVLDDYVPASVKGPLFAHCPADPRRLWVSLLEKAYAKAIGSYAAICLIDVLRALEDFTGFPGRQIDTQWRQAQLKPTEPAAVSLFRYLQRCIGNGYVILLYTPAAGDEQAAATVDLSRRRAARMAPVDGVVPQFLPGHVYFLTDAAHYRELDLRMVRLKNPWTWQQGSTSGGVTLTERLWKYSGWYERPDQSFASIMPLPGLQLAPSAARAQQQRQPQGASTRAAEEEARKGTMWLEWGEALTAFAGAGVCYTAWHHHSYRVRNRFDAGCPDFVLELGPVGQRVELLLTLTVEGVCAAVGADGAVVASAAGRRGSTRPSPTAAAAAAAAAATADTGLCGVTITITRRARGQGPTRMEEVCAMACEDVECVAARTTYVRARSVSVKVTLEPRSMPYHIIPRIDPADAQALRRRGESELPFVLAILSSVPAGSGAGELGIHFKRVPRSCALFEADAHTFTFGGDGCSPHTATYQYSHERGVTTAQGTSLVTNE